MHIAHKNWFLNGKSGGRLLSAGLAVRCLALLMLFAAPAAHAAPNFSITKSVSPGSGSSGTTFFYTIVVNNTGSSASNMVITDTIQAGLSYNNDVADNRSNVSCSSSGSTFTCNAGSFTGTVSVTFSATATGTGTLGNTACVNASNASQICDSVNVTVSGGGGGGSATFSPNKFSSTTSIAQGGTFTYSINPVPGGATATNVVMTDTLPSGLTWLEPSSFTSNSWGCSISGQTLTCTKSSLSSNQSILGLDVEATQVGTWNNTACFNADNASQVCDSHSVTVTAGGGGGSGTGSASVTKSASPNPAADGDTITYTMVYTNTGSTTLTNVILTDDFSGGGTPNGTFVHMGSDVLEDSNESCGWSGFDRKVVCQANLDDLPPGQSFTLVSQIQINSAIDKVNDACIESPDLAINPTCSADYTTDMNPGGAVNATVDKRFLVNGVPQTWSQTVVQGSYVDYQIQVTNNESYAISNFTLQDETNHRMVYDSMVSGNWSCTPSPDRYDVDCTVNSPISPGATSTLVLRFLATVPGTGSSNDGENDVCIYVGNTQNDCDDQRLLYISPGLAMDKYDSQDPVGEGVPFDYVITLTNNLPTTINAYDITNLQDHMPNNLQVNSVTTSDSGSCNQTQSGSQYATWNCYVTNNIPPGGTYQATFNVQFKPGTTPSSVNNNVFVDYNYTHPYGTEAISDLESESTQGLAPADEFNITKTPNSGSGPGGAFYNTEQVTYTVAIQNTSGTTQNNVIVKDNIPSGIIYSHPNWSGQTGSWNCTYAAPELTCTTPGSMSANETRSFTLIGTVNAGAGTINNTACVESTIQQPPKCGIGPITAVGLNPPDLSLTKADSPDPVNEGGTLTYTLTVTNSGQADTNGGTITVTDNYPSGLTYQAGSDGNCSSSGGVLTCTTNAIIAGGGGTFTFTPAFTVTASACPGPITNTATVSGGGETNTSNNTSTTVSTNLTCGGSPAPALTISKSCPSSVTAGSNIVCTLTVQNSGNDSTAGTITVTDSRPAGMATIDGSGSGWSCSGSTTETCTRSSAIAAGSSSSITITMTGNAADMCANSPIQNNATVSGGGSATANSNTTSTFVTDCGGDSEFSINDVTVTEGTDANATFVITRNNINSGSCSVSYSTSNGSAISGSDYSSRSGAANFTSTQLTSTILVPILNDSIAEPTETFNISFSIAGCSDSVPVIVDGQGVGTILDDDGGNGSQFSINDVTVTEGTDANAVFVISRDNTDSGACNLSYTTSNGSASSGSDYSSRSGTLNFSNSQMTSSILVPILDDSIAEPTENFSITYSIQNCAGVEASVLDNTGVGTILDDDGTGEKGPVWTITKTPLSGTVAVGDTIIYQIRAENVGTGPEKIGFHTFDFYQAGLQYEPTLSGNAKVSCAGAADHVECSAAGAHSAGTVFTWPLAFTVTLDNCPGPVENEITIESDSTGAQVTSARTSHDVTNGCDLDPDLSISKSGPGSVPSTATSAIYEFVITNNGAGPTTKTIILRDDIGSYVMGAGITSGPADLVCQQSTAPATLDDVYCKTEERLGPGESMTIQLEMKFVPDICPGPIVDQAYVNNGDALEPDANRASAVVTTNVTGCTTAVSDLQVTKTCSEDTGVPAQNIGGVSYNRFATCYATVKNNGPGNYDNSKLTTLEDEVPDGWILINGTANDLGFTCPNSQLAESEDFLCTVDSQISNGDSITLGMTFGINTDDTITDCQARNLVRLDNSAAGDPELANNQATSNFVEIPACPVAEGTLEKTDPGYDPVGLGELVIYQLQFTSTSTVSYAANELYIEDITPPDLTYNAANSGGVNWSCIPSGGRITCTYGAAVSGGGTTTPVAIAFDVPVTYAGSDPIINTAQVFNKDGLLDSATETTALEGGVDDFGEPGGNTLSKSNSDGYLMFAVTKTNQKPAEKSRITGK